KPKPKAVLITGATLVDGTGAAPVAASWVLVRDGRFADVSTVADRRGRPALPKDVRVIEGAGKWIVPGFVDAHVHVESAADTKAMIRWGVTSARLMAEGARAAAHLGEHSRSRHHTPELFPAAPIFTAKSGWWSEEPPDPDLDRFPADAAAAKTAVFLARSLGSREIKVMDDDMGWCRDPLPKLPKIPAEVRSALIAEARRLGLRVSVHAPDLADASDAVADGATVLAHGIVDAPVTDDLVRRMREAHVFYVPTLDIFDFLADPRAFMARVLSDSRIRESLPKATLVRYASDAYFETYRRRYPNAAFVSRQLPVLSANAAKLKAAGVDVALGTDMWAFPGAGLHIELEDFVRAGWTPLEAIRAATLVSARSLGADADRGTIETGKRADFVILENDPLRDIRNTRSIERVFKAGRVAWSRYKTERAEE
ncbi:MAG TPA: amidohydrolase family protein, partial [Thermoanaerobaculia bacterium]|nr:amidohydrolase family protein [Thermoanaerobaculia bacterium]